MQWTHSALLCFHMSGTCSEPAVHCLSRNNLESRICPCLSWNTLESRICPCLSWSTLESSICPCLSWETLESRICPCLSWNNLESRICPGLSWNTLEIMYFCWSWFLAKWWCCISAACWIVSCWAAHCWIANQFVPLFLHTYLTAREGGFICWYLLAKTLSSCLADTRISTESWHRTDTAGTFSENSDKILLWPPYICKVKKCPYFLAILVTF